MKRFSIAVLPGDGIGPEVIAQAVRVLEAVGERFDLCFDFATYPIGAAGVAGANDPPPAGAPQPGGPSEPVFARARRGSPRGGAPPGVPPRTGLGPVGGLC